LGGIEANEHIVFTPLESPAACSGDEDKIPFGANPVRDLSLNGANTGFKAPCEPSRWKVEHLLMGLTLNLIEKDYDL
jgi:hypothetical protein